MSLKLFSRNEDLQRLRADGYFVQIVDEKFLVIRQVPYVNERREVVIGDLGDAARTGGRHRRASPSATTRSFSTATIPATHRARRMELGGEGPRREIGPEVFVRHTSRKSRMAATPTTTIR